MSNSVNCVSEVEVQAAIRMLCMATLDEVILQYDDTFRLWLSARPRADSRIGAIEYLVSDGPQSRRKNELKFSCLLDALTAFTEILRAGWPNMSGGPPARMGSEFRAFRFEGLVATDVSGDVGDDGKPLREVTLEKLRDYLVRAGRVSWDMERCGDIGVSSMEIHWESLQELPRVEVDRLYGT